MLGSPPQRDTMSSMPFRRGRGVSRQGTHNALRAHRQARRLCPDGCTTTTRARRICSANRAGTRGTRSMHLPNHDHGSPDRSTGTLLPGRGGCAGAPTQSGRRPVLNRDAPSGDFGRAGDPELPFELGDADSMSRSTYARSIGHSLDPWMHPGRPKGPMDTASTPLKK